MRLLIVTQKVDQNDPILGFFHRWIEEFALHAEVIVLGQSVGTHALPGNVRVISLEKEKGRSTFSQIVRFLRLQWSLRKEYDTVLVHMTPIWVLIGWKIWFVCKKRVYLWYEARGARWPLHFAIPLVRKIFSASPYGMPLRTKKSVITGHGIDTDMFSPGSSSRDQTLLLSIGRITRSKQPGVLIDTLKQMEEKYRLLLAGIPITSEDHQLQKDLYKQIQQEGLEKRVEMRSVPRAEVVALLRSASVFLHASVTSLDKAVLEAMACECLVVSCSSAFASLLPSECRGTLETLAERTKHLLSLPEDQKNTLRRKLREEIVRAHSLPALIKRLSAEMSA